MSTRRKNEEKAYNRKITRRIAQTFAPSEITYC